MVIMPQPAAIFAPKALTACSLEGFTNDKFELFIAPDDQVAFPEVSNACDSSIISGSYMIIMLERMQDNNTSCDM